MTSGSGTVVSGAVVTVSTGSRPSVGGYGVGDIVWRSAVSRLSYRDG